MPRMLFPFHAPRTLGACLAVALLLGAAALPSAAADRTLVIARDMDINSMDPARSYSDTGGIAMGAIYESLLTVGTDNKTLQPLLAKSWESNANQTRFTFHLDPAARFSDGSPVEAKDVKWSWERLGHIKAGASYMMDGVTSIEAPDAATVVVDMDAPRSEFIVLAAATNMAIVNSDLAAAHGAIATADAAEKDGSETWFMQASAGSGPYLLVDYKPSEEVRLKRNDAYWGTKPAIGEVVIKEVKDSVAQEQMLENGGADIAMQVDPDTARKITAPDVVVKMVPSFNFLYVALCPGAKSAQVDLAPEVREAIGLAIDYDGLIDLLLSGNGKLQASPIPNGFPGSAGLPLPKRDLARARELLAKAGHPDGFAIDAAFPGMTVYGVDMASMMEKVQHDLAKVGIKLTLRPLVFSAWRAELAGAGIPLTAVFFAPDYFGSSQYVQYFSMIPGTVWAKRAGADRVPGLYNKLEEELAAKALAAPADQMDAAYQAVGEQLIKDRIIIPLVNPEIVLAYRSDVVGMRYSIRSTLPLNELSFK